MSRDPLIKSQFANYFIQDRIKAGGMATVYKAFDHERQTIIALKILHESLIDYDDIVRRFEQEAKIGQQLKHPHIVPFYDAGQYAGKLYIAMQYISGGSLAEAIAKTPQVTLSYTADMLFQIASALDFAHKRKIVHRDLKLGNILMNNDGLAMLTDFGIARWLGESNLTLTGQQMPGTVKYMSPEQAIGRTNLDYRSDLYSLAVIAYLMSVGCYPFTGVSDIVIINQHLHMDVPKPTLVHKALPPALDDVILKALSKNPDNRYDSAGEFSRAFNDAIVGYEAVEVFINMRADNPGAKPLKDLKVPDSIPGLSTVQAQEESHPPETLIFANNTGHQAVITPTIDPVSDTRNTKPTWLTLVLLIAIASVIFAFALISNEANRLTTEDIAATEIALIALQATLTPEPSATLPATDAPVLVPTDNAATELVPTEPDQTDTPQATVTSTPTATQTATPTQSPTNTPTATASPTATVTPTFTPSQTPTATATPTPLFNTLDEVITTLLALPSQSRFDCALFNETYAFLQSEIDAGNARFSEAESLLDEEDDPLREIYETECGENSNAEQHSIPFALFFDMQDALRAFRAG